MAGNRNTHYAVRNINGTTRNKCWCSSWLSHWYAATGSARTTCCVLGCRQPAQVGAHVRIDDARHYGHWYIVPFCKGHNHTTNQAVMFIKRDTTLISANVTVTCGTANWAT